MVTAAAVGLAILMALPATAQPAIYTANDGSITIRVNGQTGVCVCACGVHLVIFRTCAGHCLMCVLASSLPLFQPAVRMLLRERRARASRVQSHELSASHACEAEERGGTASGDVRVGGVHGWGYANGT